VCASTLELRQGRRERLSPEPPAQLLSQSGRCLGQEACNARSCGRHRLQLQSRTPRLAPFRAFSNGRYSGTPKYWPWIIGPRPAAPAQLRKSGNGIDREQRQHLRAPQAGGIVSIMVTFPGRTFGSPSAKAGMGTSRDYRLSVWKRQSLRQAQPRTAVRYASPVRPLAL
jgi:hypothetical protein